MEMKAQLLDISKMIYAGMWWASIGLAFAVWLLFWLLLPLGIANFFVGTPISWFSAVWSAFITATIWACATKWR